jgi:hypothetical protein
MPAPKMLNIVRYQVKSDRLQEFQEVERQIAGSYKKAAPTDQFRILYRDTIGNTTDFMVLTPMSKFADRDGENPYNKMATEQERVTRQARLGQYLERVQTSIDRTIGDLTISTPGVSFPPRWVHEIRVRVRPGTDQDFGNVLKADLVPALKNGGVKTLRVRRVVFGGNTNDFIFAEGFEKWAELDNEVSLPKIMGEAPFRKMIEKINQDTTNREDRIMRYQEDLSYYPAAPTTSASR